MTNDEFKFVLKLAGIIYGIPTATILVLKLAFKFL